MSSRSRSDSYIVEANAGLETSNINTAGGLTHSFCTLPTTVQGTTEEDMTATEKITKLKKQWIELTP